MDIKNSKQVDVDKKTVAQTDSSDRPVNEEWFEIDILEQFKKIWKQRLIVLGVTLVFAFIGVFHYISGPTEYRSTATLIQEVEATGAGGGNPLLRSIFGNTMDMAGGLGATARGYAPPPLSLYPSIVGSTEFLRELVQQDVEFSSLDTTITLLSFFNEFHEKPLRDQVYDGISNYTIRLPITLYGHVRSMFRSMGALFSSTDETVRVSSGSSTMEVDERLMQLTSPERRATSEMRVRINITMGGGLIDVSTTLPDPMAAAKTNAALIEKIQEYMTEYRIEKAKQNLEFTLEQHREAEERYNIIVQELALFQDQNINLSTARARIELDHLNDRRNLKYNIYNSISREVEQARLTVQQQTPVFNILERSDIPQSTYTGASNLILIFSIVLGFFVGIFVVYVREFFKRDTQ